MFALSLLKEKGYLAARISRGMLPACPCGTYLPQWFPQRVPPLCSRAPQAEFEPPPVQVEDPPQLRKPRPVGRGSQVRWWKWGTWQHAVSWDQMAEDCFAKCLCYQCILMFCKVFMLPVYIDVLQSVYATSQCILMWYLVSGTALIAQRVCSTSVHVYWCSAL